MKTIGTEILGTWSVRSCACRVLQPEQQARPAHEYADNYIYRRVPTSYTLPSPTVGANNLTSSIATSFFKGHLPK